MKELLLLSSYIKGYRRKFLLLTLQVHQEEVNSGFGLGNIEPTKNVKQNGNVSDLYPEMVASFPQ
jgi:hypothetical protein